MHFMQTGLDKLTPAIHEHHSRTQQSAIFGIKRSNQKYALCVLPFCEHYEWEMVDDKELECTSHSKQKEAPI